MKNAIRKFFKKIKVFRVWRHQVWKAESNFKISYKEKIKYAFRGFKPDEYIWFDLAHNDYKEYISDYERMKSREINEQYKIVLDDKLLFEEIFRNYVKVPTVFAWISSCNVYGLHGLEIDNENVIDFIRSVGKVVLKWENGYEGKGTFVITALEDDMFDVNGSQKKDDEVYKLFAYKGKAILCEYMHQSEFENSLYPYAANTLRIVCAKKKDEKDVKIIKASQRIGNEMSKPIDNVSAGAIVCSIDLETGELGAGGIAKLHIGDGKIRFFDKHPDTGSQLTGRVIPHWEKLKKEIVELTNKFPYLNLVAWDVLLTEDGFCIIEGNASAGCTMFQMEHGIRKEEFGDIYRSYGIIR